MATQIWIYPALIAVLGQNRRPSFAEMRSFVDEPGVKPLQLGVRT
ncbi:hypothetical protein [Sphingobium fuliginis]|nr:hypothetical protein [Sphingobium fuliginis]